MVIPYPCQLIEIRCHNKIIKRFAVYICPWSVYCYTYSPSVLLSFLLLFLPGVLGFDVSWYSRMINHHFTHTSGIQSANRMFTGRRIDTVIIAVTLEKRYITIRVAKWCNIRVNIQSGNQMCYFFTILCFTVYFGPGIFLGKSRLLVF